VSESAYARLPKAKRRRLLARAVLRPTLTSAILVFLYFSLPFGESSTAWTEFLFTAGLATVGVLIIFQARSISRSRYPRLQAVEAFSLSVPLYLLLFSAAYDLMNTYQPNAFTQSLTRMDSLYYTVTVFSSVGFGDIAPRSEPARIVTTIQMLGNLLLVGVAVRILLSAVQIGLQRQAEGDPKGH
jgi:hypothetical protein